MKGEWCLNCGMLMVVVWCLGAGADEEKTKSFVHMGGALVQSVSSTLPIHEMKGNINHGRQKQ